MTREALEGVEDVVDLGGTERAGLALERAALVHDIYFGLYRDLGRKDEADFSTRISASTSP